ncbi:thioredoxin [Tessaracoccus sp. OH4464_COT-324]|uniref:thioredoxin n=1 Tax=Tessaracoccus sp. OH4464_COT-324 TaxID=2491059 RepID=UPI000F6417F8|nr:thioredoxin [Tessaracoccus sp. OH4464_COT-324]RRD46115.1 thioredoxin [Tessaracoccus sp. OH4464_COT-324]
MKAITQETFADEVLLHSGLVVVDFWADWCGPCKQLAPILAELASEYPDVKFVGVDTNDQPGLAADQGVMGLPTLQFFQGGRVVKSITGGKTKNALKKVIESLV